MVDDSKTSRNVGTDCRRQPSSLLVDPKELNSFFNGSETSTSGHSCHGGSHFRSKREPFRPPTKCVNNTRNYQHDNDKNKTNNDNGNQTMDERSTNLGSTEAARIRMIAVSSPPWVESTLVRNALNYVDFLQRLHATGVTLQQNTFIHALNRYLHFWLPLVGKYPSETVLIPPADIAWLWHCHRLSPNRYEDYCRQQYGRILECQAPFDFVDQETVHNSLAREYWQKAFPKEPFFSSNISIMDNTPWSTKEGSIDSLAIKYIITSTRWHRDFLWHIRHILAQGNKEHIVRDAVLQYQKFVALSSSLQPVFLVPTYSILWIWKTHMLMGIADYNLDCRIHRGGGGSTQLIPNDLAYVRSCATSDWSQSVHDTQRHWKAVYVEDYGLDQGDMDRDCSPADYYHCSWKPEISARCSNDPTNQRHKPCSTTTVHESTEEVQTLAGVADNVNLKGKANAVKRMMKTPLSDAWEKETTEDDRNDVDLMKEAARIRIMAGSSPPWEESELVTQALKYVDFLLRLHGTDVTLHDPSVDALDRYLNYWIPLVDKAPSDRVLVPETDVAWLWHCHRLLPDRYEAYCHERFGRILECQAPFDFVEEQAVRNTDPKPLSNKYWSGLSTMEDLVACTKRHRNFLWYITKPAFRNNAFLREGVSQYTKFVVLSSIADVTSSSFRYLTSRHHMTFVSCRPLIPTHQIALIWQTHILMGIEQYNHDCRILRQGSKLVHNDSVYDRSLDNTPHWWFCMKDSQRLWKAVYGEWYGDWDDDTPPPEYYYASWKPRGGAIETNPTAHSTWNEPTPKETCISTPNKKPTSPTSPSTVDEPFLKEAIPNPNKQPKKRYQMFAESLVRTRGHKVQAGKIQTAKHTCNQQESSTRPRPQKRYQVFLERRSRKPEI